MAIPWQEGQGNADDLDLVLGTLRARIFVRLHIYKVHICPSGNFYNRYLDSQYVTADDSVLSFLNLTEVTKHHFISVINNIFYTDTAI